MASLRNDYETPKRSSLLEDAQRRANELRANEEDDGTSLTSPPPEQHHPLETPSPKVLADQARSDWRLHGSGVSQETEEKRYNQQNGLVVRVISAETRVDASGASYTTYVTSVLCSNEVEFTMEHRYGEFAKLHALLRKYNVTVNTAFPPKHWAGRMGHWTPSLMWAPSQHDDLVAYRKVQLDLWLVDVVHLYNQDLLEREARTAVYEFLHNAHKAPCQDENLDEKSYLSSALAWSNPVSFTLGSSIRQATQTVHHMMGQTADQSIPLDLLHHAQGLCFLTVAKAGLVISGKVGTGLVIAKQASGGWSAPSAIGTVGVGWGAQVGGDITHYIVVLTTQKAVKALCGDASVSLGAELGVAVGPLGRSAQFSSSTNLQPAYAYCYSHGFFVGMSLEGTLVKTRHDVNTKFYASPVKPREVLLDATIAPPRAAEPLYQALQTAMETDIPQDALRPSQLWKSNQDQRQVPTRSASPQTIEKVPSGQSSLFDDTSPSSE